MGHMGQRNPGSSASTWSNSSRASPSAAAQRVVVVENIRQLEFGLEIVRIVTGGSHGTAVSASSGAPR